MMINEIFISYATIRNHHISKQTTTYVIKHMIFQDLQS